MSNLNEITEKSYVAALERVEQCLRARKIDLNVRHVVIVPDIYTLMLEKKLFLSSLGAFDVEVATFNRLYLKINHNKKALSKQGAIMLLKSLCAHHADALKCYRRSAMRTGFASMLYDSINTLKSCAITPDELRAARNVFKAEDLALLFDAYVNATAEKYVDAPGRLALLGEAAQNGMFANCHVYVTLYDNFTAQQKLLLEKIKEHALSLTVVSSAPPAMNGVHGALKVTACADRVSEYKAVAKRIRSYVVGGGLYEDVCVVDESGDFTVPKRIFEEADIPVYVKSDIPLSDTELYRFIASAYYCARKGCRTADMLALAYNCYLGADVDDVDAFCDYVRRKCVDYKGFDEKFEDAVFVEQAERAERVRVRILDVIKPLDGACTTAKSLGAAVLKLLDAVRAEEVTAELGKTDGRDLMGIYDKTVELIGTFTEMYDGGDDALIETLIEGFESTEVCLVPNRSHTVSVGKLTQYRGQRVKLLVIVDFNDGVLPVTAGDDGLLQEADAVSLEQYKLRVQPRIGEKNAVAREELWHLLDAAENIFITYHTSGGGKPSYDLKLLMRKSGIMAQPYEKLMDGIASVSPDAAVRMMGAPTHALELMLSRPDLPFAGKLREMLGGEDFDARWSSGNRLSVGAKLLLASKHTSVSELQTYFKCPYMFFMNYGLRIKKKEQGEVNVLDVGTLLHKIVELFLRADPADAQGFVTAALDKEFFNNEKYGYAVNERLAKRLTKEAYELCVLAREQIRAGEFVTLDTEMTFGRPDSKLSTVTLPYGVEFTGSIDRVDTYGAASGEYARVVDYKTGDAEFTYGDLYYGKKIQLAVYLSVLMKNGYRPAGMFLFPFSVKWKDDEYAHVLNGPYNKDEEIMLALDRSLDRPGRSKVIKCTRELNKDNSLRTRTPNASLLTEDELIAVCDYGVEVASGAVNEIKGGYIAPSPIGNKSGKGSACDYCDYAGICGGEGHTRTSVSVNCDAVIAAVNGKEEEK